MKSIIIIQYRIVIFSLFYFLINFELAAQIIANGDFENSSTCTANSCDDFEISCIDGWWYYDTPGTTDFAWFRYDCAPDLNNMTDCGLGERGLWLRI